MANDTVKEEGQHGFSAVELVQLVEVLGRDGALCPVVVRGTSMTPTLHDGRDTVYLRALDSDEKLRVGDIVFFHRGGQVILHRVIGISNSDTLTINGDGQLWTEEVERGDVFGIVERIGRAGRTMPARTGVMRMWGLFWLHLLPVRHILWRFPAPLRHAVRGIGSFVKNGRFGR